MPDITITQPALPADLPENWTNSQYVSAGGTETGLSQQHGYNYLMKQVNDVQNAVNTLAGEAQNELTTINESLEETNSTVEGIQTSVGDLEKGGYNATATREGTTVAITGPENADAVTFIAPADWTAGDTYTYNGTALTLTDLNNEPVEDGWKQGAPIVFYITGGNRAFFKAGGGSKIPNDLPPLNPNFTLERSEDGTKIIAKADKLLVGSDTAMLAGGVWVAKSTGIPQSPKDGTVKEWSRADLITTAKPYDGLYLGDVTPSDAVTETLLWLPENDSGKVKLVPFIVLSVDYLGGVYVMRQKGNKDWVGKYGNNVTYENSEADVWTKSYLNSVLDKGVVDKLLECDIHVFEQGTIKRKCWIPSYGELYSDFTDSGNTFMPYFNSNSRRILIKQDDGNLLAYWTRTFYNLSSVRIINPDGSGYFQSASSKTAAYRPAFVLPKDFKIQQRPDGSYTVWNEQGLMKLSDIEASTESQKVAFNIPETIKNGLSTKYAEFVYGMKEYNGYSGGLLTRNDNSFASGKMYGALWVQTDAYNVLTQYATYEPSSLTLADRCLHSSIRKILMSVSVKSTDNGGSIHDNEVKCLLLSTREVNDGTYETGTPIPYYSVQANRIMKDASGVVAEAWLRDAPSSPSYQFRFIGQDGQIGTKVGGSTLQIVPSICVPLTTPIRQLADGTYDLVPEDPALSAQASTLEESGEEETPLEWEVAWDADTPAYVRQYTYNQKGQYQTMLQGAVASTEDAPAYSPVLAENTWAQIAQAVADKDPILDVWQVGDTKDEVIAGETLTFAIMGKNMDDLADGSGKAGLTFGMTQLRASTRQMNPGNTNAGSFAGSAMYSWLSGIIYPNLPTELKDAIKAVNKKTSAGDRSSSIRTDPMYLWLFAEIEVFGTTTYSYAGEGTQYPYFATAAERIKRLSNGAGAASYWWVRSPRRTTSGYFCTVDTSGSAGYYAAATSNGVCFGFCI